MTKFDVGSLEDLEYDFTKFHGRAGVIDEPSTQRVNDFFKSIKDMMKGVKGLTATLANIDVNDESDEKLTEALNNIDSTVGSVEDFQNAMMESIAKLCGAQPYNEDHPVKEEWGQLDPASGSPSLNDLNVLPYRHLLAFNQWLMGEIRPKNPTPAGPR